MAMPSPGDEIDPPPAGAEHRLIPPANPGWLQAAEAAFHAAAHLEPSKREQLLHEMCGHDPDLKAFVEKLLASYEAHPSPDPADSDDEVELTLSPGTLVHERFRIRRLLGSGATGSVYEASDERLPRTVALKVLRSGIRFAAYSRRRFEQEARALSQLRHDHIASIIDFVAEADAAVLVMEYVSGGTIRDRLKQGRIPAAEVMDLARQLIEALDAAHEKNIVHGDLKPENLGISEYGKLKVLDFGLADLLGEEVSPTTTVESFTRFAGTPAYMSPEQLLGRPRSRATDLFSAGIVLFEMLTGHRPEDPGTKHPYNVSLGTKYVPSPKQLRRETPPSLDDVVVGLLQHDPSKRISSAAVAGKLLAARLSPVSRWISRARRSRLIAAALVLTTLLGVLTWIQATGGARQVPLISPTVQFIEVLRSGGGFRDEFAAPPSLEDPKGYIIVNPDPSVWIKNQRPGSLTLVTHRGDTWLGPGHPVFGHSPFDREPRNVLLRDFRLPKFFVTATVDSFWPKEDHQQAGIIVTNPEPGFENYVRMTVAASNGIYLIQAVFERSGDPESGQQARSVLDIPMRDLVLRILFDGTLWRCEYRDPTNYAWKSILVTEKRQGDPPLSRAGLIAFHGNLYDSREPDRKPRDIPPCNVLFKSFAILSYPPSEQQ